MVSRVLVHVPSLRLSVDKMLTVQDERLVILSILRSILLCHPILQFIQIVLNDLEEATLIVVDIVMDQAIYLLHFQHDPITYSSVVH
jgi:hypothetical protein